MKPFTAYWLLLVAIASHLPGELKAQKKTLQVNKDAVIFSAIKGTSSKPDTLLLSAATIINIKRTSVTGPNASFFKVLSSPAQVSQQHNGNLVLIFAPPADFTGVAAAALQFQGHPLSIPLTGLSTNGLEGENEAPLSKVVEALGYKIDVGWKTLANHTRPEFQGEELAPSLFRRVDAALPVELIPVARYSPDFPLSFGYYTNSPVGPQRHQAGILAKAGTFPEHQTLFPRIATGSGSFMPGDDAFGFYALSPDHALYSEDCWNHLFYPARAAHATRIYAVKDKTGKPVANTFLLTMEEAANGDYNDYVFLVKNVRPTPLQNEFVALMNGKNLDGWYTWLQSKGKNSDPEDIFTVGEDGVLHDIGKELGYIMTVQRFQNFHFTLEFKWGEKRWPPREGAKRDSGICYNVPDDEPDQIWPQSVECQIQEGDVGDFWLLGYSTIQVDGKQNVPYRHSQVVKKKDAEKPNGEWNTVEVISFNGKCVHIVNGVMVNYGENASLIGGRILLQSEYAEVYYRNVRLRKL